MGALWQGQRTMKPESARVSAGAKEKWQGLKLRSRFVPSAACEAVSYYRTASFGFLGLLRPGAHAENSWCVGRAPKFQERDLGTQFPSWIEMWVIR